MASEGHHPDEINSSEMKALERELRALVPRGPTIEVAKMMYLAGQASLSPVPPVAPIAAAPPWSSQWLWPVSTAVAATAAAWLGVLLFLSHHRAALTTPAPPSIVRPDRPVPTTFPARLPEQAAPAAVVSNQVVRPTMTAEDAHYLRARETAITAGVDALPPPAASDPATTTSRHDRPAATGAVERELGIRRSVRGGWSLFGF